MKITELIKILEKKGYIFNKLNDIYELNINDNIILFDIKNSTFQVPGIKFSHSRIFDLTKLENWSVIMLLIKLFKKGYSKDVIDLEKCWQLGHNDSGYLDLMITNPNNNDIYMFEVKSSEEISKFIDINNEKKLKQVLSYAMQEKSTKIVSFYAYDFDNDCDIFNNIYIGSLLNVSRNIDDLFERWSKIFDKNNYIDNNSLFNISREIKQYKNLEVISDKDTSLLYKQFLTILRLNSISDKPNAFMKMINLFLAKIDDEISEDKVFNVKDKDNNVHKVKGLKFQFIDGVDTNKSFMKRLNELYENGMKEYINKNINDYKNEEIEELIKKSGCEELYNIFDNLRLKSNNNFTFLEVYDDITFDENCEVVKAMVELLSNFKFKYNGKYQFLGDFFENLLNTSLKQEAGQFFTPYPIVDFMINSLPYEELILDNLRNKKIDFLPYVIDYACGAGHFLISSVEKTQNCINDILKMEIELTNQQKKDITSYFNNSYSWVNNRNVIGIEKDYRLAKTTKIATFLNGDGGSEIISGDGINRFDCKEYMNTYLHSEKNKVERFDFVISNPPYSVDGYMRNLIKNKIDEKSKTFELLKSINYKDSAIEKLFVERTEQLLKKGGIASIVLPQSILSNDKYLDMRKFIFENFKILSMVLTSDITFSGTTTSPVILFLKKEKCDLDYETLIVCSPKYLSPTGEKMKNKETKFLGYYFSNDRNKGGIHINEESSLKYISQNVHSFITTGNVGINMFEDNVFVKNIKDILVNKELNEIGDIYPKYNKEKGISLKELGEKCKINALTSEDFINVPTKYVEIGSLNKNGNIDTSDKSKTTTRYCKKGDILVASLCPKKSQIIIADDDYVLTTAIHVLSFNDYDLRDKVYKELISDKTIEQMNSLLDGFKITYAKISEQNLYNNVMLNL